MSRATRREKAEGELAHLEARFRERLVAALRTCAAGEWGLFGQNGRVDPRTPVHIAARLIPAGVDALLRLGDEIDELRSSLGFADKNALFARLKAYRRLRPESAPGEPQLARQFLAELEADGVT
ncbi:MAG: hypothetical protein M3154_12290 [Candidatus Eremiobacteraeota bacterium]|nr:hypothetical protein [Candidatus Eremiobacteraeota bacterium]